MRRRIENIEEIHKLTALRLRDLFQYNRSIGNRDYHEYFVCYSHKKKHELLNIMERLFKNNIPVFTHYE